MIDETRRASQKQERDRVRRRTNVTIDKDNYQYFPEKKQIDYYDNDVHQRVAVYARVSTDNVKQTTSYELQKKYYKDFVLKHPNWTLVKIYADEGISGTSRKHREISAESRQKADEKGDYHEQKLHKSKLFPETYMSGYVGQSGIEQRAAKPCKT